MAKTQNPMQRSILTPDIAVQPTRAFEQMGEAAAGLQTLLSHKAQELAVDEAVREGVRDVEEGRTPKDLAFPFTQATKAYNTAVENTEKRRLALTAQQQIQESLINFTNPATFNHQTPAQFSAHLNGIVEGTLENARDGYREELRLHLAEMVDKASFRMLSHAIDYDNRVTKQNAEYDLQNLREQARNAAVAGQDTSVFYEAMHKTLDDYSAMNAEINLLRPRLQKQIQEEQEVNKVFIEYNKAHDEGRESQFMNDLAENKQNLPFNIWTKAVDEIYSLSVAEKKLKHDLNAEEVQQTNNLIDNGTIQTPEDLLSYEHLTPMQIMQAMNRIEVRRKQLAKQNNKLLEAQSLIMRGNSAMISDDTTNELLRNTQVQFEQATGRSMTLTDMVQSLRGENNFPLSGMPRTPLGRDVPNINAQFKNQLQSNNPQLVMEAAELFNNVVNVGNDTNSINLSGKPLSIATLYSQLNIGATDPLVLAQQVRDTVMNVPENEFNLRTETYHREFEVNPRTGKSPLAKKFKELTGVSPDAFKSQGAYDYYRASHRLHYLNTNSEEAADKAAAYDMRQWGTSKYFDEGTVAQPVPEKELNITQIGYAFDNQYRIRVQDIINRNAQDRKRGANIPAIEWIQPKEQSIDIASLTDEQKVFDRLGASVRRETLRAYGDSARPRIKVTDMFQGRLTTWETEVYLVPTAESRLGERFQYALAYKDRIGNLQFIPDITSPNGHAMFSPLSLDEYAPTVFDSRRQAELKEMAIKIQRQQGLQELEAIQGIGQLGKLPFLQTIDRKAKLIRDPEAVKEAFRKMYATDATDIQNILHQKIQTGRQKPATPAQQLAANLRQADEAVTADNVGIAADTGQTGGRD